MDSVKRGTTAGKRSAFRCLLSDVPITYDYIRTEGKAGRMGSRLMAIVAESDRGRVYLSPTPKHGNVPSNLIPEWKPEVPIAPHGLGIRVPTYGLTKFGDLFTSRQLVSLTTFSNLIGEVIQKVENDGIFSELPDGCNSLHDGGTGTIAYAETVGLYLAFVVDKCSDYWSNICTWDKSRDNIRSTFGRHAIPMVWDYAEANPFSGSSGNWMAMVDWTRKAVQRFPATTNGFVKYEDAQTQNTSTDKLVSTDPPYYDNIGYADISDFYYAWLRHSLRHVFPSLFLTFAVPKEQELIVVSYRHGSKKKAEEFFLNGMTQAMQHLAGQTHPALPVTIYYAFKQSETKRDKGTASTGWETFLNAVINAGFSITGTWPIRTELANRPIGLDTNALASSIVLVCRKSSSDASVATRHEFVTALRAELPKALVHMQHANIVPVDLAQASIGPGMAIFTRYSRVLDARGEPISVRDALILVNQTLDEIFSEREGDFDPDTRWALEWFRQQGFKEGDYGVAETLSKAKNISVDGLVEAGILSSKAGRVRLLKPEELPKNWDPATDKKLTVWEIVHHLVRVLESGGEKAASRIVSLVGSKAEAARELCYQLYANCESKKRAIEARSYNSLVRSWPEINRLAREDDTLEGVQISFFDQEVVEDD